jgi:hypothetical protein
MGDTGDTADRSITRWLTRLRDGDPEALDDRAAKVDNRPCVAAKGMAGSRLV